ncbi:MAG TPA: hypothetical protein VEQ40_13955, partial [Pyrinomonadaceae bacterium]|nr:hypothetical protein [Pyrinomonadaceae bacterium]
PPRPAPPPSQNRIEFGLEPAREAVTPELPKASAHDESEPEPRTREPEALLSSTPLESSSEPPRASVEGKLSHLSSVSGIVREVPAESVGTNIRPLGQLEASFIVATDDEGLLLIDQHKAHERILFEQYRSRERRATESQNLLMPETFDLTPAQATAFEAISEDLEAYGFGLMRLSGRTVAVRAVPADLPSGEARSLLAELLDSIEADRRTLTRASSDERIALALSSSAAIKYNTVLAPEKMRWLVDRLLLTSAPTTCPHGRPVILRLATHDIEKSFRRT